MKLILSLLLIFLASAAGAQEEPHAVGVDSQGRTIYRFVEILPWAPYNVPNYLSRKIKYPDSARKANVEGLVMIAFIIDKRGRIQDVKVKGEERFG